MLVDLLDNFSRGVQDVELEMLASKPNVTLLERDMLNPASLDGLALDYDFIFHFAAIIGVRNVLDRPFKVLSDNTQMILNALALARRQKSLKRFIFTSTSEVYAGTLAYFELPLPTPEDTPLAVSDLASPRASYMLSKIYGEALCQQSGVPFAIVRPHNVYGPRMGLDHVIPELLHRAHQTQDGDVVEVYSPNHTRTFCYIDDAVQMIARIAEKDSCANETLNIGNGTPEIKILELADKIISVVGKELSTKLMPETAGSPARRCPDMKKCIRLTGYTSKTSLETGIVSTFEWYRENVFQKTDASSAPTIMPSN